MLQLIAGRLSGRDGTNLAQTSKPLLAAVAAPLREHLLERLHEWETAGREPRTLGIVVANLFAALHRAAVPGLPAQEQDRLKACWDAAVLRLHALPLAARPAAFTQLRDALAGLPPEDRAVRLATLLDRLGDLPPAARGFAYTDSLRALRQELPAEHRVRPLAALRPCSSG